jgi:hypothetical protein
VKQGRAEITSDAAVRGLAAGTVKLTLVRLKPDWRKGFFPEGAKITFDRRTLGIPANAKIELENPQSAISQRDFCEHHDGGEHE